MNIKTLTVILLLTTLISGCSDKTIHIVHVSDVHGHFYPYDYVRDIETTNSLAAVYTFIDSLKNSGEEVIFIDTGDLLQGTPMIYYFCDIDSSVTNPAAAIYNYMGLDALIVGNHDIEKGPEIYRKFERELNAPMLSANAVLSDGSTAFDPYYIIPVREQNIGIIGLTTPAIPLWLPESKYPGIKWKDISKTASSVIPDITSSVDYLIAGVHAGIDSLYSAAATDREGLPRENYALALGRDNLELDLILCGHEHRIIPGDYYQNTGEIAPISMPGSWSRIFNHIILEEGKAPAIHVKRSNWYEPHQGLMDLMEPYHQKTLNYVNKTISEISSDLDMHTAYFYDNALIDFIQHVQLDATGADASFAACFNPRGRFQAGEVTVKDIFALYVFENYLYGIQMTGKQIKAYLEESVKFYMGTDSDQLLNSNIPGYNLDLAAGIKYTIDIAKEPGQRITILRIGGKKYKADKSYRVAMNSYRASGGGGHLSAAGIINPETYYKSSIEIRNLLISYLEQGNQINTQPDNNWKIIGDPDLNKKIEIWKKDRF